MDTRFDVLIPDQTTFADPGRHSGTTFSSRGLVLDDWLFLTFVRFEPGPVVFNQIFTCCTSLGKILSTTVSFAQSQRDQHSKCMALLLLDSPLFEQTQPS